MAGFAEDKLDVDRARLIRHRDLPEHEVLTCVGSVSVKEPRVRDRGAGENKIAFTHCILPRYLRKAKRSKSGYPWLCLNGVSTGDLSEASAALPYA